MGNKGKIILGLAVGAMIPAVLTGCGHKHGFGEELKANETQHYYECSCGEKKDAQNHEASATYAHNETHHWKDCTGCGYDLTIEQHAYTQEVDTEAYFKEETDTKLVYYKSCVCGEFSTETFDVNKTVATIENVAMPAEIIYGDNYDVNFSTNSNGQVTVRWFKGSKELNHKPTEVGNNYKVQVSIAGNSQYTSVESQLIPFEIKPYTLTGLQTTVEYNGTMYHFVNLDDIEYGLRVDVAFNSENVGATPTAVSLTINGEPTINYVIDTTTCTIEIVAKEVELEWTAPNNLKFDMTQKEPTVVATGLCGEDECDVLINLTGDNVWYGSTFTYEATELSNPNYKLPTNTISPEYVIDDITEMVLGTELLVYQHVPYGAPSYFKINLEAGQYVFDFCPDDQGAIFAVEIYKKGNVVDEIININLDWQKEDVAFTIAEDGEYYIKCNQVNDFEPQYDTIKVVVDEHTTPDKYGFCDKGCGTYIGESLPVNSWTDVTLKSGERAYFRFADGYDVKYNIKYYNSNADGMTVKCYRTNSDGEFIEVSLTDTPSMFEGSFDGYYYLVFKYNALVGSADKVFTFQIEETLNS